jgi:sigma-E factor negative regulatory protein RseA
MKSATNAGPLARDSEALSSLLDGELDAEHCQSLLAALCADPALRSSWVAFHVVGDALRSSEVAAGHSAGFCDRVAAAIAQEPTVFAPVAARARGTTSTRVRRYVLPGLAVAASAAVLGFVVVPMMQAPPAVVQHAALPAPSVVAGVVATANPTAASVASGRAASTVANARAFQAYLLAHREMTSGAALPRATPYLRPAADSADR